MREREVDDVALVEDEEEDEETGRMTAMTSDE